MAAAAVGEWRSGPTGWDSGARSWCVEQWRYCRQRRLAVYILSVLFQLQFDGSLVSQTTLGALAEHRRCCLLGWGVQVQALNVPGSAFDISRKGNWLAAGDSDGSVRVSLARWLGLISPVLRQAVQCYLLQHLLAVVQSHTVPGQEPPHPQQGSSWISLTACDSQVCLECPCFGPCEVYG